MNYIDVVVAMYGIRKEASLNKQAWIPGQHLANAFVNNAQNGARAIGGGLKSFGQGVANQAKAMANKVTNQATDFYNNQGYAAAVNDEVADAKNAYQAGKNKMQAYGQQLADNANYTARGLGMYGQEALNAAKAKGQQAVNFGQGVANSARAAGNQVAQNVGSAARASAQAGMDTARSGAQAVNRGVNTAKQIAGGVRGLGNYIGNKARNFGAGAVKAFNQGAGW